MDKFAKNKYARYLNFNFILSSPSNLLSISRQLLQKVQTISTSSDTLHLNNSAITNLFALGREIFHNSFSKLLHSVSPTSFNSKSFFKASFVTRRPNFISKAKLEFLDSSKELNRRMSILLILRKLDPCLFRKLILENKIHLQLAAYLRSVVQSNILSLRKRKEVSHASSRSTSSEQSESQGRENPPKSRSNLLQIPRLDLSNLPPAIAAYGINSLGGMLWSPRTPSDFNSGPSNSSENSRMRTPGTTEKLSDEIASAKKFLVPSAVLNLSLAIVTSLAMLVHSETSTIENDNIELSSELDSPHKIVSISNILYHIFTQISLLSYPKVASVFHLVHYYISIHLDSAVIPVLRLLTSWQFGNRHIFYEAVPDPLFLCSISTEFATSYELVHLRPTKFDKRLGLGGFASVWEYPCPSFLESPGRHLAIKHISIPSSDELFVWNFCDVVNEITALRSVRNCDGFCQLLCFGKEENSSTRSWWIIMRREGQPLIDWRKNLPEIPDENFIQILNIPLMISIFYRLTIAVLFLHSEKQIVHCDIRPGNVLLPFENQIQPYIVLNYDKDPNTVGPWASDIPVVISDFGESQFLKNISEKCKDTENNESRRLRGTQWRQSPNIGVEMGPLSVSDELKKTDILALRDVLIFLVFGDRIDKDNLLEDVKNDLNSFGMPGLWDLVQSMSRVDSDSLHNDNLLLQVIEKKNSILEEARSSFVFFVESRNLRHPFVLNSPHKKYSTQNSSECSSEISSNSFNSFEEDFPGVKGSISLSKAQPKGYLSEEKLSCLWSLPLVKVFSGMWLLCETSGSFQPDNLREMMSHAVPSTGNVCFLYISPDRSVLAEDGQKNSFWTNFEESLTEITIFVINQIKIKDIAIVESRKVILSNEDYFEGLVASEEGLATLLICNFLKLVHQKSDSLEILALIAEKLLVPGLSHRGLSSWSKNVA
eukprot:GHVP01060245.1.p1 GENE.GHVP01060245.1~~GHVP01060245.1.p1  ORF type:complete len:940 (-),score=170.22 GHVP01060245.1:817-3636(-)